MKKSELKSIIKQEIQKLTERLMPSYKLSSQNNGKIIVLRQHPSKKIIIKVNNDEPKKLANMLIKTGMKEDDVYPLSKVQDMIDRFNANTREGKKWKWYVPGTEIEIGGDKYL